MVKKKKKKALATEKKALATKEVSLQTLLNEYQLSDQDREIHKANSLFLRDQCAVMRDEVTQATKTHKILLGVLEKIREDGIEDLELSTLVSSVQSFIALQPARQRTLALYLKAQDAWEGSVGLKLQTRALETSMKLLAKAVAQEKVDKAQNAEDEMDDHATFG